MKRTLWVLGGLTGVPIAALLYRELAFRGPIFPPQPLPMKSAVDLHVHTAGMGAGGSGCYLSPEIRSSYKFGVYLKAFGLTPKDLESQGDAVVLERIARWVKKSGALSSVVVLALDGAVTQGELDLARTEIYVPNEFVAAEVKKYEELRFGASVNPFRKDALSRLVQAQRDGAVLVKWIPPIQGIDPADPALTPFYEKMKALKLPLLSHTGTERAFTRGEDRFADPRRLRLPLSLGLTVIAAHSGAPGSTEGVENREWLLRLMAEFPHLYAEISSLTQLNKLGYLRRLLLDKRSTGRLVYGSDFPLTNTLLVSPYYFPLDLTWKMMRRLASIENPFDRDVALKQALGVPAAVFQHPFGN